VVFGKSAPNGAFGRDAAAANRLLTCCSGIGVGRPVTGSALETKNMLSALQRYPLASAIIKLSQGNLYTLVELNVGTGNAHLRRL
jgi:hypothetical protein